MSIPTSNAFNCYPAGFVDHRPRINSELYLNKYNDTLYFEGTGPTLPPTPSYYGGDQVLLDYQFTGTFVGNAATFRIQGCDVFDNSVLLCNQGTDGTEMSWNTSKPYFDSLLSITANGNQVICSYTGTLSEVCNKGVSIACSSSPSSSSSGVGGIIGICIAVGTVVAVLLYFLYTRWTNNRDKGIPKDLQSDVKDCFKAVYRNNMKTVEANYETLSTWVNKLDVKEKYEKVENKEETDNAWNELYIKNKKLNVRDLVQFISKVTDPSKKYYYIFLLIQTIIINKQLDDVPYLLLVDILLYKININYWPDDLIEENSYIEKNKLNIKYLNAKLRILTTIYNKKLEEIETGAKQIKRIINALQLDYTEKILDISNRKLATPIS